MKVEAISKGVLFDYAEITPSSSRIELFKDSDSVQEKFGPVTSINESEITNWLLQKESTRSLIFEELNIPEAAKAQVEVQKPFIRDVNSKPGDIDILICDPHNPTNSIAIECKRVKVKPETFSTGQIGGLKSVRKGVEQVNALAEKYSFAHVYLMVIVQVNGKERDSFNQFFRGTTDKQKERIYSVPLDQGINAKVGIIFLEIIQVTNRPFEKNGYVGLSLPKLASKRKQLSDLSELLEKYFKENIN